MQEKAVWIKKHPPYAGQEPMFIFNENWLLELAYSSIFQFLLFSVNFHTVCAQQTKEVFRALYSCEWKSDRHICNMIKFLQVVTFAGKLDWEIF